MLEVIQVRLESETLVEIDRLRQKLSWRPSRSHAIRWMIENNIKRLVEEADTEAAQQG
jgi:metal-responsive CopG/Arc/MetJ family transcriptional regulator